MPVSFVLQQLHVVRSELTESTAATRLRMMAAENLLAPATLLC